MDLPPPENTVLSSYDEVRLSEKGGAYVAEAVDSAYLKPFTFIGDGSQKNADGEEMCCYCFNEPLLTAETFTQPTEQLTSPGSTETISLAWLARKRSKSQFPNCSPPTSKTDCCGKCNLISLFYDAYIDTFILFGHFFAKSCIFPYDLKIASMDFLEQMFLKRLKLN
jgi:hypothetical protein